MITYYKNDFYEISGSVQKNLIQIACHSEDTKPTSSIVSGSLALEVDTGKVFAFDGESWNEIG